MAGWYFLLGIALATLCTTVYLVFFSKKENEK